MVWAGRSPMQGPPPFPLPVCLCGTVCLSVYLSVRLSCSWPFLITQGMFTTGFEESRKDIIKLRGIEPHILDLLLNFAYTGEITPPIAHLRVTYYHKWCFHVSVFWNTHNMCVCVYDCVYVFFFFVLGVGGCCRYVRLSICYREMLCLLGKTTDNAKLLRHAPFGWHALLRDFEREEHGLLAQKLHGCVPTGPFFPLFFAANYIVLVIVSICACQ